MVILAKASSAKGGSALSRLATRASRNVKGVIALKSPRGFVVGEMDRKDAVMCFHPDASTNLPVKKTVAAGNFRDGLCRDLGCVGCVS